MEQSLPLFRTGLGKESHRFLPEESSKLCVVAGVIFEEVPGLDADSDGDVVFHSLCQAITSLAGVQVLGGLARDLCRKDGITDSSVYLKWALEMLGEQKIVHVSISIEGKRPRFEEKIEEMRKKVAEVLEIEVAQVGITVTSGDGLTDFGCGDGLQAFSLITTIQYTSVR